MKTVSKIAALMTISLASSLAVAQDAPPARSSKEKVSDIIKSFSDLKRDSGTSAARMNESLKKVLVSRTPTVDANCDIKTSHAILQLSFSVLAGERDSEVLIYDLSEAFVTGSGDVFVALTPKCRAVLKTFGLLVLRTRLGSDWEAAPQASAPVFEPQVTASPATAPGAPQTSPGRREK